MESRATVAVALYLVVGPIAAWLTLNSPLLLAQFFRWAESVPGLPLMVGIIGVLLGLMLAIIFLTLIDRGLQLAGASMFCVPAAASVLVETFPAETLLFALVLGLTGFVLFSARSGGGLVLAFYREWLLSDMRVSGELRPALEHALEVKPIAKNARGRRGLLSAVREGRRALAWYLRYRAPVSGAPGVWIPAASFTRRILTITGICALTNTTVALVFLNLAGAPANVMGVLRPVLFLILLSVVANLLLFWRTFVLAAALQNVAESILK